MPIKKRSSKKTTNRKTGKTGAAGESASKKRTEKGSRTNTTEALTRAAEALARAAEALVGAVNAHLGVARSRAFARTAEGDEPLEGNCLDLSTAGQIVENAINSSKFDIDGMLKQMDLISPSQREVFKQDVLNKVRNLGCQINDGDVPNAADDTARTVRDTIQAKAWQ